MKKTIQLFFLLVNLNFAFGQMPTFQWAGTFGSLGNDNGTDLAIDSQGNTYFTGTYSNGFDFDPGPGTYTIAGSGAYVCKLDGNGSVVWIKSFISNGLSNGGAIGIDVNDNVLICGVYSGTIDLDPNATTYSVISASTTAGMFITKLTSSGNFLWGNQVSGSGDIVGYSLGSDAGGNIYITGRFRNTIDFDPAATVYTLTTSGNYDSYVCKFNSSGGFSWAGSFYGPTNNESSTGIHVEGNGNIYLTGTFVYTVDFDPSASTYTLDSGVGQSAFIVKMNTGGNLVWAKQLQCNTGSSNGTKIRVDASGNVYSVGFFVNDVDLDPGPGSFTQSCIGYTDYYISKLDNSGNFVWGKILTGSGGGYAISLALDAFSNVYLTGVFDGTLDLDPGVAIANATANVSDIFLIKLDQSGNQTWGFKMGDTGGDGGNYLIVDPNHSIYLLGGFNVMMDFDPGPANTTLASNGQADVFVLKLNQCYTPLPPTNLTPTMSVFCQGNFSTLTATSSGTVSWYANSTGGSSLGSGTTFITPTLTAGNYTYYAEAYTCTNSISRTPVSFSVSLCTNVEEIRNEEQVINVFPNPSNGLYELNIKAYSTIFVFNVIGKEILRRDFLVGRNLIDLREFDERLFILKIEREGQIEVLKLLKE